MAEETTLRDEPIAGETCVHLCIDMQRLFGPGTDWALEWMPRVLPQIALLCAAHRERTIFTRFIPARRAGEGVGTWQRYYTRWGQMTIEALGPEMIGLVPELAGFVPPARVVDKPVYSPWLGSDLQAQLRAGGVDTLVVTGGETDMCVLTTLLGAIDLGYRTILVRDGICSASDEAHDATLELFTSRFGQQVEVATAAEVLELWPAS